MSGKITILNKTADKYKRQIRQSNQRSIRKLVQVRCQGNKNRPNIGIKRKQTVKRNLDNQVHNTTPKRGQENKFHNNTLTLSMIGTIEGFMVS